MMGPLVKEWIPQAFTVSFKVIKLYVTVLYSVVHVVSKYPYVLSWKHLTREILRGCWSTCILKKT